MAEKQAPCKECKDRRFIDGKTTCHSTCRIYKDWVNRSHKEYIEKVTKKRLDNDSYALKDVLDICKPRRGRKY